MKSYTGYIAVSTPATTALDLVRFAPAIGGLDTVFTVLEELAEKITPEDLLQALGRAALPHHHVNRVLPEALQALEIGHGHEPPVHVEFLESLALRPPGDLGMEPLSSFDQRGEHADAAPFAHGGLGFF